MGGPVWGSSKKLAGVKRFGSAAMLLNEYLIIHTYIHTYWFSRHNAARRIRLFSCM